VIVDATASPRAWEYPEAFIDYGTYAEVRRLADGSSVVRQKTVENDGEVIGLPGGGGRPPAGDTSQPQGGNVLPSDAMATGQGLTTAITSGAPAPAASGGPGVVDMETRTREAAEAAKKTSTVVRYDPLPDREPILIPKLISVSQFVTVSLNDIVDYAPFERLGRTLTADYSDELKRTKIVASHDGRKVPTATETANDKIVSALPLDIPLSVTREALIRRVMSVKGVPNRALELGAANRIVDRLIEAMGEKAADHLSAFVDRCGQRLAAEVARTLRDVTQAQVTYDDDVELVPLNKTRETRKRQVAGHADGSFDKAIAFNGWSKNLYSHAWFDAAPEFKAANAIDSGKNVVVWARLHINDVPIKWTSEGREYHPDFVVIEEVDGQRIGWLVETKADKDMSSAEVVAKRKAARKWANTANSSPEIDKTWKYLLVGEQDIEDAQGSW
jgi:type III restriction enzyme